MRLSTESIRQHCQPGWYPLEAWCLQYNQHIDKTLLHPIIEITSTRQENAYSRHPDETYVDTEATPTSDTHHLTTIPPEIVSRKSPNRKHRHAERTVSETNPFKEVFKHSDNDFNESVAMMGGKVSAFVSRNPFEKLPKRSGKVIEDADDLEEYVSQDECEKSGVSSVSSSPNYNQSKQQSQSNIGTWTAGVMGGSSSKLQAQIQKWFKSDSFDGNSPRKRNDFAELASVSVREMVKVIGGNTNDGKGSPIHPLSQSSSPISIPFSKLHSFVFFFLRK